MIRRVKSIKRCEICGHELRPGHINGGICCAGAAALWRCVRCRSEVEAFAVAYGRCSDCGGEMVRAHSRTARANAAQDAVREAFELELGGAAFYREGADHAASDEVRALFQHLAELEEQHIQQLFWRYHVRPPEQQPGAMNLARMVVYGTFDAPGIDAVELLELAVELEERAQAYLEERRLDFQVGSPEWELYSELAADEAEHAHLLRGELKRYRRDTAANDH